MYNLADEGVQFSPTQLFIQSRRGCSASNGQGVQLGRYIQLLKLTDENQDYGFIFYASESNGKFIVSNAPRDVNGVYQWFYPTDQLFFYDRTLTGSHMAYSYQEIGLYDRLTYIK